MAAPGNGCAVTEPAAIPGGTTQVTCKYTAGSATGGFAAATPNHWVISVAGAVVAQGSADSPNPAGTFAQSVGDLVVVTLYQDCAPPGMPCGAAGTLAAGDAG